MVTALAADGARCEVALEGGAWGKAADGTWSKSAGGGTVRVRQANVSAEDSLVGVRVRIAGLEGRPELNGTFGCECKACGRRARACSTLPSPPHERRWARSYDVPRGRYMVEPQDGGGQQYALRPENVRAEGGLRKEDFMRAFDGAIS